MGTARRIFLCAGEASGDRYAAKLAERLLVHSPDIQLSGVGGERMEGAGVRCHIHLTRYATVGIVDVLKRIGTFARLLRQTEQIILRERPDVVVLIDNPGFNLRVAAAARRHGMRVIYYVGPQIWAWYPSRIKQIARRVDKMLVILPFEAALYRAYNVDCEYVGHPMLDYLTEARLDEEKLQDLRRDGGRLIGLLPGSREQEVKRVFPLIARAAGELQAHAPDVRFVVACARPDHVQMAGEILKKTGIEGAIYDDRTFEVMQSSRLCIVASGTATLELCYFGTPMVVVYRAPALARLARWIVKTKHISLVNILAGREVVPEFMQFSADHRPIAAAARELLLNSSRWQECRSQLRDVLQKMGTAGASDRAAEAVLAMAERAGIRQRSLGAEG